MSFGGLRSQTVSEGATEAKPLAPRRVLQRGKMKETPVLPEFQDAQDALKDLDSFLDRVDEVFTGSAEIARSDSLLGGWVCVCVCMYVCV